MESRPIVALILYQVIFAAMQLVSYNAHGWLALTIAWIVIIVATLVDTRRTYYKIVQAALQTIWFIVLLVEIDPGEITLKFLKSAVQ